MCSHSNSTGATNVLGQAGVVIMQGGREVGGASTRSNGQHSQRCFRFPYQCCGDLQSTKPWEKGGLEGKAICGHRTLVVEHRATE